MKPIYEDALNVLLQELTERQEELEIVKCKECKLNKTPHCAMAFHELNWNDDDDFCSWAEKGEPNETN